MTPDEKGIQSPGPLKHFLDPVQSPLPLMVALMSRHIPVAGPAWEVVG